VSSVGLDTGFCNPNSWGDKVTRLKGKCGYSRFRWPLTLLTARIGILGAEIIPDIDISRGTVHRIFKTALPSFAGGDYV
jgi:hypothetical protein